MKLSLFTFLVFTTLFLPSWSFAEPSSVIPTCSMEPKLRFERTGCFGMCPIYTVSVCVDGKVLYFGERFVRVTGIASKKLNSEQLQALDQAFIEMKYFALKDKYEEEDMTDHPSVAIRYCLTPKKCKAISHYLGMRNVPKSLYQLEDKIDQILGTAEWVKETPVQKDVNSKRN